MQTREQAYAHTIFTQVSQVSQDDKNNYGTMAHKLPVLIRTAGLAQSLAFVTTRKGPAYRHLMRDLGHTLGYNNEQDPEQVLLKASQTTQLADYMHLTRRVLAALVWYKRFAESVLDVTADADLGTGDAAPAGPPAPAGGAR